MSPYATLTVLLILALLIIEVLTRRSIRRETDREIIETAKRKTRELTRPKSDPWDDVLVTHAATFARFNLPDHIRKDFTPAAMPCTSTESGRHHWGSREETIVNWWDGKECDYSHVRCMMCGAVRRAERPRSLDYR